MSVVLVPLAVNDRVSAVQLIAWGIGAARSCVRERGTEHSAPDSDLGGRVRGRVTALGVCRVIEGNRVCLAATVVRVWEMLDGPVEPSRSTDWWPSAAFQYASLSSSMSVPPMVHEVIPVPE